RPDPRRCLMSAERPTVSPQLLAALIDSTPDRVRRRLDSAPDAAKSWEWQASKEAWAINTGGETVTLPHGHVVGVEQFACTCLLSPRCFNVLACLTSLKAAVVESAQPETVEQPVPAAAETDQGDDVEPDEKQQHAARALIDSMGQLLRVGAANAGV